MKKVPIIARNDRGHIKHTFRSQSAACAAGFCRQAINACVTGRRKRHGQLSWARMTLTDSVRQFALERLEYHQADRLRDMLVEFVEWYGQPVTAQEFNAAVDDWLRG